LIRNETCVERCVERPCNSLLYGRVNTLPTLQRIFFEIIAEKSNFFKKKAYRFRQARCLVP
jgi:hypothetical protein